MVRLEKQIKDLTAEIANQKEQSGKEAKTSKDLIKKVDALKCRIDEAERDRLKRKQELNQETGGPERIAASTDTIAKAKEKLQKQIEDQAYTLKQLDGDVVTNKMLKTRRFNERIEVTTHIARAKTKIKRKNEGIRQTESLLQSLKNKVHVQLEKKTSIQADTEMEVSVLRQKGMSRNRVQKENERKKKQYEKLRRKHATLESMLPPLQEKEILLT